MTPAEILAVAGPVIALLVNQLKRIEFVSKYPKLITGAVSLVIAAIATFAGGSVAAGLVTQVLTMLIAALAGTASAVTTYEVAKAR